jgi:large subunit ribosomal protein L1
MAETEQKQESAPRKAMPLEEAIKWARANSEKKKFVQTFDLSINLKNIDMKKPESKLSKDVALPHGTGFDARICVISDNVKNFEPVVGKNDIAAMEADKKGAKLFCRSYEFYLAEAALMPLVGKILGKYLAPKGRMPKLLPPNVDPNKMAAELKQSVRLKMKDSPVIHAPIGREDMSDEQVRDNAMRVIEEVRKSLPGKAQIRNGYIKLTMGKAAKVEIKG